MAADQRVDFQRTLAQVATHEIGGALLALATPAQLQELAQMIAERDLYHFPSLIKLASQFVSGNAGHEQFAVQHIEHLLWIEHRRALWASGRIQSEQSVGCTLSVENEEYLDEVRGIPTILLTPMTLGYEDALWVAAALSARREIAMYGEGLMPDNSFAQVNRVIDLHNIHLVGDSSAAVRTILRVLKEGGCFLTYPDFVYAGHQVQPVTFFGVKWPISSAFVSLCARPRHNILPCSIKRENSKIVVELWQPIEFDWPNATPLDQRWVLSLVGATLVRVLEDLVLSNPAQWLLLSTMVAECQQRAALR